MFRISSSKALNNTLHDWHPGVDQLGTIQRPMQGDRPAGRLAGGPPSWLAGELYNLRKQVSYLDNVGPPQSYYQLVAPRTASRTEIDRYLPINLLEYLLGDGILRQREVVGLIDKGDGH
jgi:hypothetical protein